MSDAIPSIAAEIAPSAVDLRRAIHRDPEVGWSEKATTERIAEYLAGHGLDPSVRSDGMGLSVDVGGEPTVGFRADLDALPIQEETELPFRSLNPGVMHACGHDVHAAIGAGLAASWNRLATTGAIEGGIRVFFQPAEEVIPGGAQKMRQEGVTKGLDSVIAYHVDPSMPAGQFGLRTGAITGASDRIMVTLNGPGGHTSRPHQTVDLVYVAARIITDLPVLVRQDIDPRHTAALVFGLIEGSSRVENVIPTHVTVGGTIRLFELDVWRRLPDLIEKLIHHLVAPYGATAKVDYVQGSPPVVNDARIIASAGEAIGRVMGADAVADTHQSLGSEDFSWFLEEVPGALIRLGSAMNGRSVDLHSATFDVDEACIEAGIAGGVAVLGSLLR
ncbi:MAG: amidohydrolase [Acidimicrobiia bacterium]|nr:amidohydrolase [Acidimicrobiia bacterium]NNF69255.1 amidohydrolase [Acidimicrobiia bacterium]NNK91714.1 amidohydrolase [Acidimicrobiia bacterium]